MHSKKSKSSDNLGADDVEGDDKLLADIWGFSKAARASKNNKSKDLGADEKQNTKHKKEE